MKTKSNNRRKKTPPNPALDLFGEVPVLLSDLEVWVFSVAPRWYGTRRMAYYIHTWNVADKVRRAKLEEWFEQMQDNFNDRLIPQPNPIHILVKSRLN